MQLSDDFFDDLEESINKLDESPERIAFYDWQKRFETDFKSGSKYSSNCWHKKKTLDPKSRMVKCDNCSAYLDPYDVLERLIRETQAEICHRKTLQKDLANFQNKIEVFKKELRSLNGKIKRRKAKAGE